MFRFHHLSFVTAIVLFAAILGDAKLKVTRSTGTLAEDLSPPDCVVSAGGYGNASFRWSYNHTKWEQKHRLTEQESIRQMERLKTGAVYLTKLQCPGDISLPRNFDDTTSRRTRAAGSGQREDPLFMSIRNIVYKKSRTVWDVLSAYVNENTTFEYCKIGVKAIAKNANKSDSNKQFIKWMCGLVKEDGQKPTEASVEPEMRCGPLCRTKKTK